MMKKETFCELFDATCKLSSYIDDLCKTLGVDAVVMDDPLNDIYNVIVNDSGKEWPDEAYDDLFDCETDANVLYDKIMKLEDIKNGN